jgi:HEAT repeats
MPNTFKAIASALVAAVVLGSAAAAQQPRIENGAVTPQAAAPPLAQSFRALVSSQADIAWIGYSVPVADGDRVMCCFGSGNNYISGSMSGNNVCCGVCTLENSSGTTMSSRVESTSPSGAIKLEGPDRMVVLFRIAERRVDRVRVFSEDCRLDAGGRPVKWLENVRPAESIALLESLVAADSGDRVSNSALMAISQHADPSAIETLLRMARTNSEPRARGEALFWLAQRAGDKVAAAIRERIDQDPDTDVKKKAVFALSQLPRDQGVPLLIQVARTNKTPEVRRQAMFWLGQSKDPRAVEFFAEILSK